jgi:hypothetical protein
VPEAKSFLGGARDPQEMRKLESNIATFTAASLLPAQMVVVFPHSPKVTASRKPS